MVSLIERGLDKQIARGLKGLLLKGTLRRETPGALNNFGDATTATTTNYKFEGIREDFDKRYRVTAGIPETDVKILIIAGSIKTVPKQGDKVFIRSKWHIVREILSIDPANASYALQAYEAPS